MANWRQCDRRRELSPTWVPWSSGFRPFNYRPLLGMSWVEWLAVVLLVVTSLAIMGLGMRSK